MKTTNFIFAMVLAIATSVGCTSQENGSVQLLTPEEAKTAMAEEENLILVDVRTPQEFAGGSIEGAENIDYFDKDFKRKFSKFDKDEPIYIICQSGNRSGKAGKILSEMGFQEIYDIKGGFLGWED